MPAGLRDDAVYTTGERSEAEALGRPLLGPHRLQPAGRSTVFRASLHAAPAGPVSMAHLALGQETEVVLVAPPRFLVVAPVRGRAVGRTPNGWATATPRCALVLAPGSAATIRCGPSPVHLVGIERQPLLTHLSRLLGRALDRPLAFDAEMDLSALGSHRWNVAVGLVLHELAEPRSLLRRGIGPGHLDEFLMSALLYGHRSTYSAALRMPPQPAPQVVTRSATDFIETHLDQPLSLAAIAAAVGLSARTLQLTFRSELQTTPTAYIRDRRLDRVRADLAAVPSSEAATVTEIASRWGINHLGRFAVDYRARFGESPSQTLRG